jgi:hypothetical protein
MLPSEKSPFGPMRKIPGMREKVVYENGKRQPSPCAAGESDGGNDSSTSARGHWA